MKVKCISSNPKEISESFSKRLENNDLICGSLEELKVGSEYEVICIEELNNNDVFVYLPKINPESGYPPPYPIDFFEVIDETIPSDWCVTRIDEEGSIIIRKSFREWSQDDMFYENLLDEEPNTVKVYQAKLAAEEERLREFESQTALRPKV